MRYEYEYQSTGAKVKIIVDVFTDWSTPLRYTIADVMIKPTGKRKYISEITKYRDKYEYRQLDNQNRELFLKEKVVSLVGENAVKLALDFVYSQLKPDVDKCCYRI